jgi:hypothetical protein
LIATIYSDNKAKMLNRFHVWFPGGIVIGGILAWLLIDTMGMNWQLLTGLLFIPLALYAYMFFGQAIPETERVATGVSYKDMLRNVGAPFTILVVVTLMILVASVPSLTERLTTMESTALYLILGVVVIVVVLESKLVNKASLLFPFVLFCMFLTASTELGTNQWINALLSSSGINGMLILVVVTGIMAVGRFFAGPLIHRLNPAGVLLGSAIFSFIGLYLLSVADGAAFTMFAAIVFAVGVCYFWPTMLGFVAEYIPGSGALGLSIMGGAGMVATSMVLPLMGESIDTLGPQMTLRYVSILPGILVVLFIGLNVFMRGRKSSGAGH